jgi:hypothetical protein
MRVVLVPCPPVVPSLFVIFSSPCSSLSSRPHHCCPHCPCPYCSLFLPHGGWGCCGGGCHRRLLLPLVCCSPFHLCRCHHRCRGQEIYHPASSGSRRWVSLVVMSPCHPLAVRHLLVPVIVVPSSSSSSLRVVVVVINSSS